MKVIKKNQVVMYLLAFILVMVGYLGYIEKENKTIYTSSEEIAKTNIGDAELVSSQIEENTIENKSINTDNKLDNNSLEKIETSSSTENDNYFVNSKLERDSMYSQMLETYEKILNSSSSQEIQKQSASDEISKINKIKNSIMICENLIETKGFKNNVIFVNGDSISVIVEAKEIKQDKISQIENIISREMNAKTENIHISTK